MSKIKIQQLATALYETTEGKSESEIQKITSQTIQFLDSNNMISKIPELMNAYQKIWENKNNILHAKLYSRSKLQSNEENEIKNFLKQKYKVNEVETDNEIDKNILGGIRIEFGDTVIDATVNRRIDQLTLHLK